MNEAYEKKLNKVRVRIAREAKAKIKELKARYGIKEIVHDCYEPGPSGKPTKLHFRCVQEDSEWWFATYSKKKVPAKVFKLLSSLESFVSWNKDMPGDLLEMMADETDWIIETGLVHEGDLVDEEEVAKKERVRKASLPVFEAIRTALSEVDQKDRDGVIELIKLRVI